MKKRMVNRLLAAALTLAMAAGVCPAMSVAAAEPAEPAAVEAAAQEDAEDAFWRTVSSFMSNRDGAAYKYMGENPYDEENPDLTKPMQIFKKEAQDSVMFFKAVNSEESWKNVEPMKEKGAAAVAAYNEAVEAYEAVKAAYENCSEEVRTVPNDDGKTINDVWDDVQAKYEKLQDNLIDQTLVDYYAAWCDAYGPVRKFIVPATQYLGVHFGDQFDRDGFIDEYNAALAAENRDNEKILDLYKKAMEARAEALEAEPAFVEKFTAYTEAYNKMVATGCNSVLYQSATGTAHARMNANLDSGDIYRASLPEVLALSTGEAPDTKVNDNVEELVAKIDLTDAEQEAVNAGKTPVFSVTVDEVKEPESTELEKIEAAAQEGGYTIGQHMNIEVSLMIGTSSRKVTDFKQKISLSFEMPKELVNTNANVNRSYEMIRVHNGKADRLVVSLNVTTGLYEFESEGFSTYTIIYKDTPAQGSSEPVENNDDDDDDDAPAQQTTQTAQTVARSPKTGDEIPFAGMGALLLAAAAAICAARSAKRSAKHLS